MVSTSSRDLEVLMAVHGTDDPAWLGEALDSLLDQSLRADAVVVVSDGPLLPELEAVIESRSAALCIRRRALAESQGLGAALALGLAETSAELVARMDADDVCEPDRFAVQFAEFREDPSLVVLGTNATLVDAVGRLVGERRMPLGSDAIHRHVWAAPIIHPSVMFRRAPIVAVGGYDPGLRTRQDYDLWFRCVEAGYTMRNLETPLLRYRVSQQGKHRDLGVVWRQALTGWKGCRRVRAPLKAWIGVALPLVLALLPEGLGQWLRRTVRFTG